MNILIVCTDDRADVIQRLLSDTPVYRLSGIPSDPDFMLWHPQKKRWRRLRKNPFPPHFDLAFVHEGDNSFLPDHLEKSCTVIVRFSSTGYSKDTLKNRSAFQMFTEGGSLHRDVPLSLLILFPFKMHPPWPVTPADMTVLMDIVKGRCEKLPACCDLPDDPMDVLSPLLALDILIQGYLAIHSTAEPWKSLQKSNILSEFRMNHAKNKTQFCAMNKQRLFRPSDSEIINTDTFEPETEKDFGWFWFDECLPDLKKADWFQLSNQMPDLQKKIALKQLWCFLRQFCFGKKDNETLDSIAAMDFNETDQVGVTHFFSDINAEFKTLHFSGKSI